MIRRTLVELLITAVVLSCGITPSARGQSYGTELPFVLGTGARSSGMGVAAVTLADDASVQHYNPSGLAYLQWKEFVVYRTSLFDSKSVYHALSYAQPLLKQGTLAVSLIRVDAGGIEERDVNNQLLSTDLHNAQTRVLLGFARTIAPSVAAGLNIKIDNQSFGEYSGSGVGVDVGFTATQRFAERSFFKGLREGFAIQNLIEPSLKLDRDDVADPMNIAFGLSAVSGFGNLTLVTSLDFVNPRYSPFDLRFGQEVVYDEHFALRFGFDEVTPTYGFGARFRQLSLDYAFRSEDLGDNHRISLAVRFGASLPQQRTRARERLEAELNTKLASRMAEMENAHIASASALADSLFLAGDYEQAAARYEMTLLWDPENEHAEKRLRNSKYRQALLLAKKAIAEQDYIQGLFYSNRALSISREDSTAAALATLCDKKLKTAHDVQALLLDLVKKSIDLYANRRFAEALSGFEEVLRIAPDAPIAIEYVDKCRLSIESAVREHRADAATRAKRGDYGGSITALKAALEYMPHDPTLLKELEAYKANRNRAENPPAETPSRPEPSGGEQDRPRLIDDKTLDQYYRRGMSEFNAGNFETAISSFMKVWTANPDYFSVSDFLAKAYLYVGMGLYSDHKYTEAIEAWEKALTVDPTNSKAKRYLSKAHEELERLSGVYYGK